MASNFTQTFSAQAAPHPHLSLINGTTFESDGSIVATKAASLLSYQQYLASARAVKAKRGSVQASFEQNVLAQAIQAQSDLQALSAASLRMLQQVNHTDFWGPFLGNVSSTLGGNGPVTANELWNEALPTIQNSTVYANFGLTKALAAAVTTALSNSNASLVLNGGNLTVETPIAGASSSDTLSIRAPGAPLLGINDLLQRQQFDQVVSAFNNQTPVYMEVVPSPTAINFEPGDLFALGAIMAGQGMAEHVRKLQDTGLATYQGNDPVSFVVAIIIAGLVLGAIAGSILYFCGNPPQPTSGTVVGVPSPTECAVAYIILALCIGLLGAGALLAATAVGGPAGLLLGGLSLAAFATLVVDGYDNRPRFQPQPASG